MPTSSTSSAPVVTAAYGDEAVFAYPSQASTSSVSPEDPSSNKSTPLVMAYYPDWIGIPPEKINFALFDWIDYAFAIPNEDYQLTWDDPTSAPDLLERLVAVAHANGKKAKLSIGGWTGSQHFSDAVATDETRQTFVTNILEIYKQYNLDGIDIDWEYPGIHGQSGNRVSHTDAANFLLFLQLLRTDLPADAIITAATQPAPFADKDGQPMQNVSQYARVLDWIMIMNYDVWSSSSTPGPNAPFYDRCHNSSQPEANAVAAYNAWSTAGFPASQMVLGLPSYGYISKSNASKLRSRFLPRQVSGGTSLLSDEGQPEGQIQFRSLVAQSALVRNTTGEKTTFVAGNGFIRDWDECSSTPFLRSPEAGQVVSYDDTESLAMKASFAKAAGMLGVNVWDVHGDTDASDLVKAIRRAVAL
ncbi:putative chitinase [Hymenopellis radicata]|nr:putative chitinase [Hymenopellis radicata]